METFKAPAGQAACARTRLRKSHLAALALALTASQPASAMIFNLTYDADAVYLAAGLSTLDIANMKAANAYAATQFTGRFTDPIHVNIKVEAVAGTGTLGSSSTFISNIPFATLRARTLADATTLNDATATGIGGSFSSAVDPVGGSHNWWVSTAQAKALGYTADNSVTSDGTFRFGTGFNYTYDSNNRAVAGKIDFIGVAMHEMSEIMGRIGNMGGAIAGSPAYMMMDLFHYTGAGVRGLNSGAGRYFSIDNGTSNLKAFNNASGLGGDLADWANGANDSFNAFSTSGVLNDFTAVDLRIMDAIGYDLAAVPEPSTYLAGALLLLPFGLHGFRQLRSRKPAA